MENHIEIFNIIYSIKDKISEYEFLLLNNKTYELLKVIDGEKKPPILCHSMHIIDSIKDKIEESEYNSLSKDILNIIKLIYSNNNTIINNNCNHIHELNDTCINYKILCDINSNFKYIKSIKFFDNKYINKDIENIKFIDYKICENNINSQYISMFVTYFEYINRNESYDKNLKKHLIFFIVYVIYDTLLKNYVYIDNIKLNFQKLYKTIQSRFIYFYKREDFRETAIYYNINIKKWNDIFTSDI